MSAGFKQREKGSLNFVTQPLYKEPPLMQRFLHQPLYNEQSGQSYCEKFCLSYSS